MQATTKKRVYIILPRLNVESPAKGAVALASGLAHDIDVVLVSLNKPSSDYESALKNVTILSFGKYGKNLLRKIIAIRSMVRSIEKDTQVFSISYCFSADLTNYFLRDIVTTISSVRGNLLSNYSIKYGFPGKFLASLHFYLIKNFSVVTALSNCMKEQLVSLGFHNVVSIGNFVDEHYLESRRQMENGDRAEKAFRFIYIGSLIPLKKVDLLVSTVIKMLSEGIDCELLLLGSGELEPKIQEMIEDSNIGNAIQLHGYVDNPYILLQSSDCIVLPSVSEGISRSLMESLYFGVWCIARDIDGANELVEDGQNGVLFVSDEELLGIMTETTRRKKYSISTERNSRLPVTFRQDTCCKSYLDLLCSFS